MSRTLQRLRLTVPLSRDGCKISPRSLRAISKTVLMLVTRTQRKSSSVRLMRRTAIHCYLTPIHPATVKVIKGPIWESKLLDFVGRFTKRRSEFEFALTIHTARGVDAANQTLGDVDRTTQEMKAKMDMMMKMFERFVLPEQKKMAQLIEKKGGVKACQESDKTLRELNDTEKKSSGPGLNFTTTPVAARGGPKVGSKSDFDDLKDDLRTDPDEAIAKNLDTFSRKFEIQKRQITEELSKVMRREGDRIISAVTSGPHDKIIDPVCYVSTRVVTYLCITDFIPQDVYMLWKEMVYIV